LQGLAAAFDTHHDGKFNAQSKKPNRRDRVGFFCGWVVLVSKPLGLKNIRRLGGAQDVEIVDYHARMIDEKNNATNDTRVAR